MPVQTQLQTRRGTAASWTSTNPTLAAGEFGYETDTGKFKIGNGSTAWASLAYTAAATAVTYLFNATSGQTTFSGADANGLTLAYTVGAEQVYLNGVLQVRGSDYTASNGTSIVLASGALTSDVLNVIAYSAMTITDTYTQAQADAKFYQTAVTTMGGKNFILNGGMDIWQRGTSFTTSGSYCADRWLLTIDAPSAGTATQITSSLPTGFTNSIRVQRNSGNTGTGTYGISQAMETIASIPLQGQTIRFSFWAKAGANYSNASSVLNIRINSGTGTNQSAVSQFGGWTGYTESAPDVTITTAWARYSGSFTVPSNATQIGVRLFASPTGTAGANDWFEVTGLQLEIGTAPTIFTRAGGTIAGELAACQRYYYRQGGDSVYQALTAFSNAISTTTVEPLIVPLPVTMRVEPTVLDTNAIGVSDGANAIITGTFTLSTQDSKTMGMIKFVGSGLTQYRGYVINANNSSSAYVGLSAEL